MLYGAISINLSKAIGDAFEKKYGIKLQSAQCRTAPARAS
jgi:hypothetical protein